jgi:peptidoglycan/xylan/chitin deacetylase (PgdA/CDA1 family)
MTNRFLILMYHMVSKPLTPAETKYACPPELFEQHMASLRKSGFTPVSLDAIDQHLRSGALLPDNAVAITLDDGFEDNYLHAFPILSKHRIPATIFLATGHLNATNQWMDKTKFSQQTMLSWEQIKLMDQHADIDFGAHTVNHPHLPELDRDNARQEIMLSKQAIEQTLGKPCKHFAYPYGQFTTEHSDIVKDAGFTIACSTRSGFNDSQRDPYALHRIEVYGDDPCWKLKQKMTFGMNDASLLFPLKYYTSRIVDRFHL